MDAHGVCELLLQRKRDDLNRRFRVYLTAEGFGEADIDSIVNATDDDPE